MFKFKKIAGICGKNMLYDYIEQSLGRHFALRNERGWDITDMFITINLKLPRHTNLCWSLYKWSENCDVVSTYLDSKDS